MNGTSLATALRLDTTGAAVGHQVVFVAEAELGELVDRRLERHLAGRETIRDIADERIVARVDDQRR